MNPNRWVALGLAAATVTLFFLSSGLEAQQWQGSAAAGSNESGVAAIGLNTQQPGVADPYPGLQSPVDPANPSASANQAGDIAQYEHMLLRDPIAPDFLPLPAEDQQYLEQLLDHWEKTSSQVNRLTCEFQRWDYDPTYCNWRDPRDNRLAAARIVRGKIQYGAPDKADSQSLETWDFAGPKGEQGQEADYKKNDAESASERWLCDGNAIYEYDYSQKKLYEIAIPTEFQGAALSQSPLPFLFGAKRTDMQDRYWMRVSRTPTDTNEYWIEAWPKRRDDAVNYQRVEIVISGEDFLPKSVHIYNRDYDAARNPVSHHFEFANKRVNDHVTGIRDFFGVFIRPHTPIGWERVPITRMGGPQGVSADAGALSAPTPGEPVAPIR